MRVGERGGVHAPTRAAQRLDAGVDDQERHVDARILGHGRPPSSTECRHELS
jgi:hypothetical protein